MHPARDTSRSKRYNHTPSLKIAHLVKFALLDVLLREGPTRMVTYHVPGTLIAGRMGPLQPGFEWWSHNTNQLVAHLSRLDELLTNNLNQ